MAVRFNPKADISGGRVTDVRGGGGGGGMGNIPIGGITGGGIGTTIVVIIIFVIMQFAGGGSGAGSSGPAETTDRYEQCQTGADANESADCARVAVALSLEGYWAKVLPQQTGKQLQPTQIITFTGGTYDRLRERQRGRRAVLLPDRPDHLPRHDLLRGRPRGTARRPGR